jgi:hypothetical protein
MSIWTDGLPAWWAMIVALLALAAGTWLGELHGRGLGARRFAAELDEGMAAARAVRQIRSWRPPELHHEARPLDAWDAQVAHAAWQTHEGQALAVANGVRLAPEDEALLAAIDAEFDKWRADNL